MMASHRNTAASILMVATAGVMLQAARADTVRVEVKNLGFSPAAVSARVGDTVEWVNDDFVAHTATARNGTWDVNLPAHGSGHILLKQAGTIDYYCRFHPNMRAQITVAP